MKIWDIHYQLVAPNGRVLFKGLSSFETDDSHNAKSAMRMFEGVTWIRTRQDRPTLIANNPDAKWRVWAVRKQCHRPEKANNLPKKPKWVWRPWKYGALSGY